MTHVVISEDLANHLVIIDDSIMNRLSSEKESTDDLDDPSHTMTTFVVTEVMTLAEIDHQANLYFW